MASYELVLALSIFIFTLVLVIWRPAGIHETIPALTGASLLCIMGIVRVSDILYVSTIVRNAALTIVSTFIMSSILAKAGLFRWAAINIAIKTEGQGKRLFIYSVLLSLMLTLFLNNDGSILIGTPILIELTKQLKLSKKASFGILVSAALIGTASSAPIGVSNLANLEAMTILGLNLIQHTEFIFLASVLGIVTCGILLYLIFRKDIPENLDISPFVNALDSRYKAQSGQLPLPPTPIPPPPHPPIHPPGHIPPPPYPPYHRLLVGGANSDGLLSGYTDWWLIQVGVAVVVLTRIGFFIGAYYDVPVYLVAVSGALIMLLCNSAKNGWGALQVVKSAPWQVLFFAFGMELTVWGLRNVGFTDLLGRLLQGMVGSRFGFIYPGILVAFLSNLMNNHPALIVGTLTLKGMELGHILRLSYTANVLGSDLGSLITPIGTLASLMWFHICLQQGYRFTWGEYLKTTIKVIPAGFAVALAGLSVWSLLVR